ncbi:SAM-dependent methyltransferase [Lactobacillus sp. PV037]|uniref:tRNA (adenine(22)-N(1))-methyltransferase n=1 Tax=unclassified Lactobacillus TaxID=2620435 RepID=UPI00223F3B36|nr:MULTISPECIES: class I SAM-dependent methyltransferase [unclassified Lactobacillus]QNQ82185.1 SAM-dependent methyltransferase [Lactobacillus sp. PV012]QNQ83705.1 SAM-dependent methyltransferase [Lactobacillus sp. PV037]
MEERLGHLAEMVDQDARLADIGTDHAYLPIELIKRKKIDFAIASDVAKGPLENAKKDIAEAGLQGKIETRLGSGLETLTDDDNLDTIVIAGMGGKLMTDLLEQAKNSKKLYPTLILEPNVGEPGVRSWLVDNQYKIVKEEIIEVSGHIYELIKATLQEKKVPLSEMEIQFGPELLKEKNSVFTKKWTNQLKYQTQLLSNLNKAKVKANDRIKETEKLIAEIKEVL